MAFTLPEKTIKVSVPYLVAFIMFLVSLGIGYGSYKTRYEALEKKVDVVQTNFDGLKEEIIKLRLSVEHLTTEMQDMRQHNADDGK